MFAIVGEKGHTTTGEAFNQTAAMTAMLARLRARKVFSEMGDRLLALGVADVDSALSLEPGTTYAREFGKNGPDGYNAKKARVVKWINHLTTFNEATIARMKEVVDPVTGDVHLVKTAESRPVANTLDPQEREARVLAERYLAQMGWQHGKGSFGDTAVMLANGTEFYLPTFWLQELTATMDRTAKVGVAFADTTSGGAGIFGAGERRLAQVVPPDAKTAAEIRMRQGARFIPEISTLMSLAREAALTASSSSLRRRRSSSAPSRPLISAAYSVVIGTMSPLCREFRKLADSTNAFLGSRSDRLMGSHVLGRCNETCSSLYRTMI
jgi:hypothetical protein